MTLFLAFMCLLVGFLCGATSIGGILLIPAIQYCADMPVALASGTALCSFFFTAAWGTWLHWKRGHLERGMVLPQCLGAAAFGCLGALAKSVVGDTALGAILAVLIIVSGVGALRRPRPLGGMSTERGRFRCLLLIACPVGFLAGLTGMGGPVLSIPMQVILGFPPLAAVAAAQPFQMFACLSGTVGNAILDMIDWKVAMISVVLQGAGLWLGVWAARFLDTAMLKKCIAHVHRHGGGDAAPPRGPVLLIPADLFFCPSRPVLLIPADLFFCPLRPALLIPTDMLIRPGAPFPNADAVPSMPRHDRVTACILSKMIGSIRFLG